MKLATTSSYLTMKMESSQGSVVLVLHFAAPLHVWGRRSRLQWIQWRLSFKYHPRQNIKLIQLRESTLWELVSLQTWHTELSIMSYREQNKQTVLNGQFPCTASNPSSWCLSLTGPGQLYWTADGTGCQPARSQSPLSLRPSSCQKVFQLFLSISVTTAKNFNTTKIMVTIKVNLVWKQNVDTALQCAYTVYGSLTRFLDYAPLQFRMGKGPNIYWSVVLRLLKYTSTSLLNRAQFIHEESKTQHLYVSGTLMKMLVNATQMFNTKSYMNWPL